MHFKVTLTVDEKSSGLSISINVLCCSKHRKKVLTICKIFTSFIINLCILFNIHIIVLFIVKILVILVKVFDIIFLSLYSMLITHWRVT